jgi:GTP-binding protein
MADGCLLVVDAFEGPMPQTRFVLGKALEAGLKPVVVVNKCDRPDARARPRGHEVFDLLVELGRRRRRARLPGGLRVGPRRVGDVESSTRRRDELAKQGDIRPVFEAIVSTCRRRTPGSTPTRRCRCWSPRSTTRTTWGASASGACSRGRSSRQQRGAGQASTPGQRAPAVGQAPGVRRPRAARGRRGRGRRPVRGDRARGVDIGDTLCDPEHPDALPPVTSTSRRSA